MLWQYLWQNRTSIFNVQISSSSSNTTSIIFNKSGSVFRKITSCIFTWLQKIQWQLTDFYDVDSPIFLNRLIVSRASVGEVGRIWWKHSYCFLNPRSCFPKYFQFYWIGRKNRYAIGWKKRYYWSFCLIAALSCSIKQKSGKFIALISLIYQEKHAFQIKTNQQVRRVLRQ